MKIGIASDHAGFELKKHLLTVFPCEDLGTHSSESVDYPIYAERIGLALKEKKIDRGILLCGSGVGVCIAANRMPWVRAAICHDTYSAHQGVEHDDMNVLIIGARIIAPALAEELVRSFLQASFTQEERHQRRLSETEALYRKYSTPK